MVSILVFVELALERCRKRPASLLGASFNPCFCGTGARTVWLRHLLHILLRFNPCFCGTGARTVDDEKTNLIRANLFQSLFLWNWRSNYCGRLRIVADTWFQSLFLWNWRSNRGPSRTRRLRPRVSILVFVELALEREYPIPRHEQL